MLILVDRQFSLDFIEQLLIDIVGSAVNIPLDVWRAAILNLRVELRVVDLMLRVVHVIFTNHLSEIFV